MTFGSQITNGVQLLAKTFCFEQRRVGETFDHSSAQYTEKNVPGLISISLEKTMVLMVAALKCRGN